MLRNVNSIVLTVLTSVVFWVAIACKASPAPEAARTPGSNEPSAPAYTAPREGTTSLVQNMKARRDANGQVTVEGRLLLPQGTRVWVELYQANSKPNEDPISRAELYLGPDGSFEAGPFNVKGARQVRTQVTSHFTLAWQPAEVIALVGLNGTKLPKSALTPNNPGAPQSGGHLDSAQNVTIEAP